VIYKVGILNKKIKYNNKVSIDIKNAIKRLGRNLEIKVIFYKKELQKEKDNELIEEKLEELL
jgi:hypothetical protein